MSFQAFILITVFGATAYVSGLAISALVQREWRTARTKFWLSLFGALVMNAALYLLAGGSPILHLLAVLPGCAVMASIWLLRRK
jgi:uncharacterized membrane protein YjjP (DUF1212 family)